MNFKLLDMENDENKQYINNEYINFCYLFEDVKKNLDNYINENKKLLKYKIVNGVKIVPDIIPLHKLCSITEDDEKFILDKLKIIWAYFYDLSDYFENINYITKLKLIHQYSYDKIISLYIEMYKTQPRYIIKIKPYY